MEAVRKLCRAGSAVLVLCTGAVAAATPRQAQLSTDLEQLAKSREQANVPGCALSLRAGGELADAVFGDSNVDLRVRNASTTVFHAGSIAKQFTATAILMLAADGKLSLEDPVTKFVPELRRTAKEIKVRHLLEHTSGIRDYTELLLLAGGHDIGPIDPDTLLALLASQHGLNFDPGTRFSYSNSGYALLALIVQRVAKMSLADFAARNIFEPLGMLSTQFVGDHRKIIPGRAQGYRSSDNGWQRADYLSDVYGDGGLFTTAPDLSRWTENLQTGRVGGKALIERLQQATILPGRQIIPWGLGLELRAGPYGRTIGHGGRDFGFQSYMLVYSRYDVAAVVLCNDRDTDAYDLALKSALLALPAMPREEPAQASPAIHSTGLSYDAKHLESFAGTYFSPGALAVRLVVVRDGRLVWARGKGIPLERVDATHFRFPDQPVELEFSELDHGKARKLAVLSSAGPGTTTTNYRRVSPPSAQRGGYLGTFHSDELDSDYAVTADAQGDLTFRANPSFAFTAEPRFSDAFGVGEDILVQFTRRRGRIAGFKISTDRARNVEFRRTGPRVSSRN